MELNHLVYASCGKAAMQAVEKNGRIHYAGQATWRAMSQLSGCVKPPDVNWQDYATGPLFFERNEQHNILHVRPDNQGG